MKRILLFLALAISGSAAPPVVFYTDLVNGPKVGGPSNNGTILTICGKNFGLTRDISTVTIGGGAVATYIGWGVGICKRQVDGIQVAIGASAASGAVKVTVGGVDSNTDVTFAVTTWKSTADRIFCVSTNGSDSNNGQWTSDTQTLPGTKGCWQHLRYARGHMTGAGDIVYLGTATDTFTSETGADPCGLSATLAMKIHGLPGSGCGTPNIGAVSGTAGHSNAIVGYPGAGATLGGSGPTYPQYAIASYGQTYPGPIVYSPMYWTISSFTAIAGTGGNATGGITAIAYRAAHNIRIVNMDVQIPFGENPLNGGLGITVNATGAVDAGPATPISCWVLGNYVHNYKAGPPPDNTGWRHTFPLYVGTDGNQIEIGWNEFSGADGYSALGIHLHSSPTSTSNDGYPLWGLRIHDNFIHDTPAGNDMGVMDPSKGIGIQWYNNLFIHQGDCNNYPDAGTAPGQGWSQGYRRNAVWSLGQPSYDENWAPTKGSARIYNNTIYDGGHCSGNGYEGLISWVNPVGSAATVKPPPNITICSGSCALIMSGTLAATGYTPRYAPHNVGFETKTGSVTTAGIVDDGLGNLVENGSRIGTICYDTDNPTGGCVAGAYSFTLLGSTIPSSINFTTIFGYTLQMENNIVWSRDGLTEPYLWISNAKVGNASIFGDHNLFYTVGGQTVPSMFTANIGANADPLFVSNGTLGTVPSNGDFHIQGNSPASGAGVTTAASRDYDGKIRQSEFYSVGAFEPGVSVPSGINIVVQ